MTLLASLISLALIQGKAVTETPSGTAAVQQWCINLRLEHMWKAALYNQERLRL
jgi:hypothetical protein